MAQFDIRSGDDRVLSVSMTLIASTSQPGHACLCTLELYEQLFHRINNPAIVRRMAHVVDDPMSIVARCRWKG